MSKLKKIAGVDEVGRGCLAGPVFSAAVILNNNIDVKNINRDILFENIDNSKVISDKILLASIESIKAKGATIKKFING